MHTELGIATLAQAVEEASQEFTQSIEGELIEKCVALYTNNKRRIDYAEHVRAEATVALRDLHNASRKDETEFGRKIGDLIERNFLALGQLEIIMNPIFSTNS